MSASLMWIWAMLCAVQRISALTIDFDQSFSLEIALWSGTAQFSFICPTPGWCAVALGPGMKQTDVIIVFLFSNGTVAIEDGYSFDYIRPSFDSRIGGTNDLRLLSIVPKPHSQTNVTLTRPLRTADPFDSPILKGPMNLSFAYSHDPEFDYHYEKAGRVGVDLAKAGVERPKAIQSEWATHGEQMCWTWLVIVPVLVGVMRVGRGWRVCVWVHAAGGLAIVMWNGYLIMEGFARAKSGKVGRHFKFGMLVAALSLTQVISGLITLLFAHKTQSHFRIKATRSVHFICGICMFMAALRNVWFARRTMYGFTQLQSVAILSICAIAVCAEIACRSKAITKAISRLRNRPISQVEVKRLISTQRESTSFLNQYVLNTDSLLLYHPGGVKPIQTHSGDNMGKYLYGVVPLKDGSRVSHSSYALQTAKRMAIGTLPYPEGLFEGIRENPGYARSEWRLCRKQEVAEETWGLEFVSKGLKCVGRTEVEMMGKYVMVKRGGVRRYYSLALCMRADRLRSWVSFCQTYSLPILPPDESLTSSIASESTPGVLPLIVRASGPVSRWLASLHPTEAVSIKGPFGPGLGLDQSSRGDTLAIVAGTGLIPFLDLMDYLWWKEAKAQGFPVDFDTSGLEGFRLTVWVAFRNEGRELARWLRESLNRLCEGRENQRVAVKVWYSTNNSRESRFDSLRKELRVWGLSRVWICGPAAFEHSVYKLARKEGVAPGIIAPL